MKESPMADNENNKNKLLLKFYLSNTILNLCPVQAEVSNDSLIFNN